VKFKLDENLSAELAADLRALGHDADTVLDEGLRGAPDATLVRVAAPEASILLTLDKGIANLLQYPPHEHDALSSFDPTLPAGAPSSNSCGRFFRAYWRWSCRGK
jgi:hypothetical protein